MRRLMAGFIAVLGLTALVGCEYSEGIGENFGPRATEIFLEIDDDTMTTELSDRDDLANADLLAIDANTDREVKAAEALADMVELQEQAITGDREALQTYLKARKAFLSATFDDTSATHLAEHNVYDFKFYEED